MIAVVHHFEDWMQHIGAPEPLNSMRRWTGDCKVLGADHLFLIDITTFRIAQYYTHKDSEVKYKLYSKIEEIEDQYPDATFVYFEDKSFLDNNNIEGISLLDFKHPEDNVIYVVGPNFGFVEALNSRRNREWVYIPCRPRYTLFAETVLSIALYDRMTKAVT